MSEVTNHYGATAAREHGRPGREVRPKSLTIDMHSHVMVPAAMTFTQPYVDPQLIPIVKYSAPDSTELNKKQGRDRDPNLLQADLRLADMAAAGIDMQIIMPPPPQCTYSVPLEVGIKAARMVNEGLAEFVAKHPDKFAALGTVPMQDGKAAAAELERSMKENNMKGAQILTNVNGIELSDPAFAPFWEKAEELGAVVLLHPNGFTEGQRMSRYYFNNVIGNPLETTMALHYLIFDGVLERHPALKIVAVHGGGYLAAYSGRIDHAWGARSDTRGKLPNPPTSYLKKIYFDSVVFTTHQLRTLIEVFGAGHVVMGTDYPYDMAESDPIGHLATAGLNEADFAAIAGGNAKKLFGV